jgi:chromosome condensin MukBEF MukE localization factor
MLRSGRHVSHYDGRCYRALCENEREYRELFASLGFTLTRHDRDFFYLQGSGGGSFSAKAAVFFFIMAEWVSDNGESVTEALFESPVAIVKLPHLERERYRKYMAETGVDSEETLMNLLNRMQRLGFIEFQGEEGIIFRDPSYRFLDLCAEISAEGKGKADE